MRDEFVNVRKVRNQRRSGTYRLLPTSRIPNRTGQDEIITSAYKIVTLSECVRRTEKLWMGGSYIEANMEKQRVIDRRGNDWRRGESYMKDDVVEGDERSSGREWDKIFSKETAWKIWPKQTDRQTYLLKSMKENAQTTNEKYIRSLRS